MFASGKVRLLQTPAPLRPWGPLALVYLQRVICAVWAKMFVVLPSRGCSCQPCPWTSPSSSKHQLCPGRQKWLVIIRISDFFPKGTGRSLQRLHFCSWKINAEYCILTAAGGSQCLPGLTLPTEAHGGTGDGRLKLLDEKDLLMVVLLCSLQLWKRSEPTQAPSPSPAPSPTSAPGLPAVSPQAIKYFVSFPFLFSPAPFSFF